MRDEIRFIHGQVETGLRGISPTTTVLEWLRLHAKSIGTKEGCAEGDCGACTVVLGEPDGGAMRYRPVNACILFVAALDGRQLLTVEHLRSHPAQRAMVEHHGSQCGFCTPGFVMSVWAMGQAATTPDRGEVVEALAGNLCRCTGYRPIVDAAMDAVADPGRIEPGQAEMANRLRALPTGPLRLADATSVMEVPHTTAEVVAARVVAPNATLLAGGTDIGLWVTKDRHNLPHVIVLDRVPELAAMRSTDRAIEIGATVPYEDALAALTEEWPQLGTMLRRLGSRQIRHRGTIGGNLGTASPIGDMAPALIALDAFVVLAGPTGERTVPVAEFFIGYRRTVLRADEIIARVELPRAAPGEALHVSKITKRREEDISSVCAAFRLRLDGDRIADFRAGYGGVAATPLRLRALEDALTGQPWTLDTVHAGGAVIEAALTPLDDVRASAAYRLRVAKNLLLRFWHETRVPAAA